MWITKFYRRKIILLVMVLCLLLTIANLLLRRIPDLHLDNGALDQHKSSTFDPRSITHSLYTYLLSQAGPGAHADAQSSIGGSDGIYFHWDNWVDLSPGDKVLGNARGNDASGECGAALDKFSLVNPYFMESFQKKVYRGMANLFCIKEVPQRILVATDKGFIEVPVAKKLRVDPRALSSSVGKGALIKSMERVQNITSSPNSKIRFHPHTPLRKRVDVDPRDFVFNLDYEILNLKEGLNTGNLLDLDISHLKFLEHANRLVDSSDRYFKYPWIYTDVVAGRSHHTNFPFFKRYISTRERQSVIQHMVRAWFKFAEMAGVVSWVNWGSLLGWTFNGVNMPWDTDVDIQIPIAQLDRLARKYNSTLILENPRDGNAKYLLEISPTYVRHGNGRNFIDARFIEVNSGLYIDISALASTGDEPPSDIFDGFSAEDKLKAIPVHCKNWNWHLLQELLPIRHTYFEDSSVYIPHNVLSILTRKYGASSYTTALLFANHQYHQDILLWVPRVEDHVGCVIDPKTKDLLLSCKSSWIKDEYNIVRKAAQRHHMLNRDVDTTIQYSISDFEEMNLTRKDAWDYFDDIAHSRVDNGDWYSE